ncbi:Ig-like domain-containing protein [Pseudomonas sp. RT6P73]
MKDDQDNTGDSKDHDRSVDAMVPVQATDENGVLFSFGLFPVNVIYSSRSAVEITANNTGLYSVSIKYYAGGVSSSVVLEHLMTGPGSTAFAYNFPGYNGRTGYFELIAKQIMGGEFRKNYHIFMSDLPDIDDLSVFTNTITGSGGDATTLRLITPHGTHTFSDNFTSSGNRWSTPLRSWVNPGKYTMHAEQSVPGYSPRYSIGREFLYLTYPKVDTPANNGVVKLSSQVPVSGTWGADGQPIQVMNEGRTVQFGRVNATTSGAWGITFNANAQYPKGGSQVLNVRHVNSDNAAWTQVRVFFLAPPTIDPKSVETEMNARIEGAGHTDISGHSVDVYYDLLEGRIGAGWVVNGRWFADVQFSKPGPNVLTAVQLYGGVESERAARSVVYVKPPQPTLKFQLVGDRVELHGTGYKDALMDVHFHGNNVPFLDATVNSGIWRVAIPDSAVPGNSSFTGRQSVSNGGSGRIFSTDWVAPISVNIPTPKPSVRTPTVSGLDVTFTGTGHQWSTYTVQVVIFKNRGVTEADALRKVTVSPTRDWAETVTLPPGSYQTLHARQWVNSQYSDPVALSSVVVRSPPPILEKPEPGAIVGQTPQFIGSAYKGSKVTFSIPGILPFDTIATTLGTFNVPAKQELPPGTYTMTVKAEFGGQTSDAVTLMFTAKTPIPVITVPDDGVYDPIPTITGKGYKHCWVVIRLAGNDVELGRGPVDQDGNWKVKLPEQPLEKLLIYAVQFETQNSPNKSDATAAVTVNIQLRAPNLLVPLHNGRPERTSQFSGKALEGSTVELWIKGQSEPFMKNIPVNPGGDWDAKVSLPAGPLTLEVSVRYRGSSSAKTERVVTVVPHVPKIDTPREGGPVGAMLSISGFGFAGDDILVHRRTHLAHLATVEVTDEGTWSASVRHNMVDGDAITAMARAGAGLDSKDSIALLSALLKPPPRIIEPQPGDWTGVRPLYSGLAEPGATITVALWFDADSLLAEPTVADENGRWSVRGNKDLTEGAAWVVIRQTLEGTLSEWGESGRFMVERMPNAFEAPTVTFPLMGQEVGRWPMFEGRGVPGAEVIIYKKGEVNTILGRAWIDRQGAWAVRSLIELAVGDNFECSVHQTRDGVISKWLTPDRMFNVIQVPSRLEVPIIDTPIDDPLQQLEQQPVFSGRGIPGAEVSVYIFGPNEKELTTRVNAQGNWSVRTEFVLPVGQYSIDAKQSMDGSPSPLTARVHFTVAEKLELPVIASPATGAHISPYGVIEGTALPGTTVRLVRGGNPNVTWGQGVADAQGKWLIVLQGLPVGNFQLTGEGTKDQMRARWMTALELKVINAG